MTIPTLISFILGVTVDVILLAYGARRLLAERRFSLSRTIVAGLAGQALTSTIFTAMASGWHLGAHQPSPAYGAVLGFAALSWACGLLLAMAILVTWQAFIPAGTVPPPATWPRSLHSRAARSRRYWQIVRIFTRSGVGPMLARGPRSATLARSLTEALDRSGVVFVKFGQAMSTRRDLLPPEFTSELGRLQDRVSPLPWAQIERVLGEDLGGTGMFAEIDTDPLASASIAQVHAATLRSGERVVLKILRPGVASLVERCCSHARRFAKRLSSIDGVTIGNDVVLNQVLVHFGTDDRTRRVIDYVQTEGTCWMGGTTWRGRHYMRISVSNWSTTEGDVDRSVEAIAGVLKYC